MTEKTIHISNIDQTKTSSNLNIINTDIGEQKTETHEEILKLEHLEMNITQNNPQNSTSLMEHADDPKIETDHQNEEEAEESVTINELFQVILGILLMDQNGEIIFSINQMVALRDIVTFLIAQKIEEEKQKEENASTDNSSDHEGENDGEGEGEGEGEDEKEPT